MKFIGSQYFVFGVEGEVVTVPYGLVGALITVMLSFDLVPNQVLQFLVQFAISPRFNRLYWH